MNERPGEDPFPTPGLAVGLALGAGLARAVLILMMVPALGSRPALVGIATIVAFGATFALAAPRLPTSPGPRLGFVPASRWAWFAVPLLIPSLLLISELENVARELGPAAVEAPAGDEPTAWLEAALVLIMVLPICEEIFFRGLLQPGSVQKLGAARGVMLTAALQGATWGIPLLAQGLGPFVLFAGMGLVLGVLRQASGSILPGLGLACLFGVVSTLATARAFGIPGFDETSAPHTPLHWLAPAALFTGIGLGLCRVAARSASPAPTQPGSPGDWEG
jgi:membrane protease YdiL (CAAX protease family)